MRKKRIFQILTAAISFVIWLAFLSILLSYMQPMKDKIYNLSLSWEEGEGAPINWVYDQKGWTVFTQEGETVAELSSDGYGGFTGLDHAGQTFYFSRTLNEVLDSPTLWLDATNSNLAVFLDGRLLYTDCPELDHQIGRLTLPTPEWERIEPVLISLPLDYMGKTLTIAQSTNTAGNGKQGEDTTVYPCSVTLYCGYAYESYLIAESFQTAVPAVIFFLAGAFLLAVFVWSNFQGKMDIGLLCAAIAAFLWVSTHIMQTSFAPNYFGILPVDAILLSQWLSVATLLAFISSYMTGRRQILGWVLTGVQITAVLADLALQLDKSLSVILQQKMYLLGIVVLLAALCLGFWEWRSDNAFFRLFCLLTATGFVFYGLVLAGAALMGHTFAEEVWTQIGLGAASYFLRPLYLLMMVSALASAIIQLMAN